MDGGEEIVEYMLGPRGKVEVGAGGVSGLAREVYGCGGGDGDLTAAEREEREEFEARLRRSLGMGEVAEQRREAEEAQANGHVEREEEQRRRSSRRAAAEESEEESDSD